MKTCYVTEHRAFKIPTRNGEEATENEGFLVDDILVAINALCKAGATSFTASYNHGACSFTITGLRNRLEELP